MLGQEKRLCQFEFKVERLRLANSLRTAFDFRAIIRVMSGLRSCATWASVTRKICSVQLQIEVFS